MRDNILYQIYHALDVHFGNSLLRGGDQTKISQILCFKCWKIYSKVKWRI